jgi:hypothetical protein
MRLINKRALAALSFLLIFHCAIKSKAQTQTNDGPQPSSTTENKQTKVAESSVSTISPDASTVGTSTVKSNQANLNHANTSVDSHVEPNAAPQTDNDEWHFQFSPYLWVAGINGQAGIGNLVVDVDSGITSSNVKLNSGFMGVFEARKNKWLVLTDIQYSNLGTERPNPGILFSSASADFKTFILDPEVGYRITENPDRKQSLDIVGGVRYWHLETNLNFGAGILPAASATRSKGWVDAVGGVRARAFLTKKFFLAGKVDAGGGGAKFTYQLFGVGGYQITDRIALIAGWRHLKVNYDKDNFLFDMALDGPVFGATFIIK